ncbi:MAG TPA: type II toxin-antitoxin system antitoxin SocA domain-containing protein [Anaeromyxobacteraceae bacterium]|nr:type II toxin-antitoxin system antitoxin SocA domain-containing protein [Anaeromyxobacteraceae bacterium]
MVTAKDVAAHILRHAGAMSAMKLQKLVYYAQAWSLALRGAPLFRERVQAWAHGPVVYELFELHRGRYVVVSLPPPVRELTRDERALVDGVVSYYGTMTAEALSTLTHGEKPWQAARAGVPDGKRASAVISVEAMRLFYASQPVPFAA